MPLVRTARQGVLIVAVLAATACAGTGGAGEVVTARATATTTVVRLGAYVKTFDAGDAGTLTYRSTGERLELVEATAAGGWQSEVLEEADDSVSVAFREGGGDEVIATVALQEGRAVETVDVRDATPPEQQPSEADDGGDDEDERPGRGRGRDGDDDDDDDDEDSDDD